MTIETTGQHLVVSVGPTQDTDLVNKIANDPGIYPHITKDGDPDPLEFADVVKNTNNLVLLARAGDEAAGFFLFTSRDAGVVEVHTCILPKWHGQFARAAALQAMRWLFTRTPVATIVTACPVSNARASVFAKSVGMAHAYTQEKTWPKGGVDNDVKWYYIDLLSWFFKHCTMFRALGVKFCEALGKESTPEHAQAVGVAATMIQNGLAHKAEIFFNGLGPMLGHAPMHVMGKTPKGTYIYIQDALVRVASDMSIEVVEEM